MNVVPLTRMAAFFAPCPGAGKMIKAWYMSACPAAGDCSAASFKKAAVWSTTSEDRGATTVMRLSGVAVSLTNFPHGAWTTVVAMRGCGGSNARLFNGNFRVCPCCECVTGSATIARVDKMRADWMPVSQPFSTNARSSSVFV